MAAIFCAVILTGCNKTSKNADKDLASSLRTTCTAPFVGRSDTAGIYLPTAFTPNGDGNNDVYSLIGAEVAPGYFSNLSVKIYDTDGALVYQSMGTSLLLWDGKDQTTNSRSKKYKFYVKINYTTAHNTTDSGGTYVYLLSGGSCVNGLSSDIPYYRFPAQFSPFTGYDASWSANETYCH